MGLFTRFLLFIQDCTLFTRAGPSLLHLQGDQNKHQKSNSIYLKILSAQQTEPFLDRQGPIEWWDLVSILKMRAHGTLCVYQPVYQLFCIKNLTKLQWFRNIWTKMLMFGLKCWLVLKLIDYSLYREQIPSKILSFGQTQRIAFKDLRITVLLKNRNKGTVGLVK